MCPVCNKPYFSRLQTGFDNNTQARWCRHDNEAVGSTPLYFTAHEKGLINNLPKDKVLVKKDDGSTYVCEKTKPEDQKRLELLNQIAPQPGMIKLNK